jgi:hypothetical protein
MLAEATMGDSMHGRFARPAIITALATLLLAGCVTTPPDPMPLPTRLPVPTAAARPADPAPPTADPIAAPDPAPVDMSVTHITVRPEHLDLENASGDVVATLSYDADAEVFIDTLSQVLGGDPAVEERPGGHEWSPSTRYTWPGVGVADDHERDGYSWDMNVSVSFTHPIIANGISVSTAQGFRPGDDLQAFAEELGEDWHETEYNSFPAETGPEIGERMYSEWDDTYWKYANANAVSVSHWTNNPNPSVTSIIQAPWNFGIGHV